MHVYFKDRHTDNKLYLNHITFLKSNTWTINFIFRNPASSTKHVYKIKRDIKNYERI